MGFFTGFINFFGWLFDLASIVYIMSELVVQMYAIYHPNYTIQPWHIFVSLTLITWICIGVTIFFNRFLPIIQQFGLFVVLVGGLVTIIVLAAMPKQHASHSFVWTNWDNQTGWSSGVAFLTGVLNGAFTIGTPDAVTHMAEELPNPKRDLPRAIAAQLGLGVLSTYTQYDGSNLNTDIHSHSCLPLRHRTALWYQRHHSCAEQPWIFPSRRGLRSSYRKQRRNVWVAFHHLLIAHTVSDWHISHCAFSRKGSSFACLHTNVGLIQVGRTFWALARDNATPFPKFFGLVNEGLSCPIPATLLTGLLTNALGAITLGSKTAFSDLAGSFVILSTTSYAMCFIPHMLTGRRNIPPGAFWMGKAGYVINGLATLFIILFNIMFCFPYALPTTVASMNYNSVILVGVVSLISFWWLVHGLRKYPGPKLGSMYGIGDERRLSKI